MDFEEFLGKGQEAMTVRRVFGEAYVQNGVTVVPAARIRGAIGGGGGDDKTGDHEAKGKGGGMMVNAAPVGVYVIRGEEVTWIPSFDLNRVILGGQLTAVVAVLVFRKWLSRDSAHTSVGGARTAKTRRNAARKGSER